MDSKQFITLRVQRKFAEEVRRIAARESETQSTIFRRLLRLGLSAPAAQHRQCFGRGGLDGVALAHG
jgi:hypothetical protein